jgi:hypothetical protein
VFKRGAELSTRSDRVLIPGGEDRFRQLLMAEAQADTWRIVEAFSQGGLPFELELAWSSGHGAGAKAMVSVAHATRVSVYARSLRIRARNTSADPNLVGITIADGHAQSHNQWEVRGEVGPGNDAIVAIPPFARAARLELADVAAAQQTVLQVIDGDNVLRSSVVVADQAPAGVLVGGAGSLRVTSAAQTAFRLTFTLNL